MNKKSPHGKRPAAPVRQPPAASPAKPQTAAAPAAVNAKISPKAYAGQDDQAPAASLDATWGNLHPARIWPD